MQINCIHIEFNGPRNYYLETFLSLLELAGFFYIYAGLQVKFV